ncbi:MAG TPA: DUF502 domain-containing protein [Phycisphaerae bacterium]|nr:DUF502 domain-containing protein [Phycisphaerae bacterium]
MPEPESTGKTKPHRSRIGATLKALVRTRVMAGVLVVLPIYVTIFLIKLVFGVMRDSSQWVVLALLEAKWFQKHVWKLDLAEGEELGIDVLLTAYPWLDWFIAILSVLLTILILYAIGVFTANIFGRRLVEMFERFVARVPMVKTVYRSSKQILATLAGGQTQSFQRVALVPFPQEKMRCVGFVTAMFNDSRTGEELAAVFIPTTPNPTTGYLQILKRKDLVELDWSVEEAVQTIMSGGILRPDFVTMVPQKEQAKLPPEIQAKIPEFPGDIPQSPPPAEPHSEQG